MSDVVIAQWQLFDALEPEAFAALKASIREHGILVPVEVDEQGTILDGHHRVRAWTELRAEGVSVPDYPRLIRVGMDDAAKRRHVIMLNLYRRHLGAEQRARFIRELRSDGMTLEGIAGVAGVSSSQVHRDLESVETTFPSGKVERIVGKDGKKRASKYKPRAKPPKTAFALNRRQEKKGMAAAAAGAFDGLPLGSLVTVDHRVLHASVREAQRHASQAERDNEDNPELPDGAVLAVADACALPLADGAVDLIVTSPPYALDIDYHGGDVAAATWPTFLVEWLTEARRVAKPSGRLALNVPLDTFRPTCRPTYADAVQAASAAGWNYRSTIVWVDNERGKSTARGSVDSAAAPYVYAAAEMIALFSAGEWGVAPRGASDIAHADWLIWADGLWTTRGEVSAWEQHPAPFPVEIARRLIYLLSFRGDTVLDPFLGSGTTAVAALRAGRRPLGFDISPRYIDSATRRLAREGGRLSDARAAT